MASPHTFPKGLPIHIRKNGVWDSSYVSTGVHDQSGVVEVLGGKRDGNTDTKSDLGNGQSSYGYR